MSHSNGKRRGRWIGNLPFVVAYQRDIKCEQIKTGGWIPATPQWHGRPHPTRPRHDQMCGRGGFQATYVINLLLATIAQLRNIFKVKHIYLNICDHLQTYEYTSLIISIFTSRFPDLQSPSPSPSPLNQCANKLCQWIPFLKKKFLLTKY